MSSVKTGPELTSPPAQEIGPLKTRRSALSRMLDADKKVQVGRIVVLAGVFLLWQVGVDRQWVEPLYAAGPLDTFQRLWELLGDDTFYLNLRVTLGEAAGGWVLGSALGLILGLVLGRWTRAAAVFDPFLTFINATPKIALAPFFILWFGIGPTSKVVLAATIVLFIVQVPTQAAVRTVNPDLITVVTTMRATELQKFQKVVLPGIMAPVFGALRLAMVYALLAAVLGEFIAAQEGLGQQLITATNQFDMPTAFSLLIVLAALAVVINSGLSLLERRLLRWQTHEVGGRTVTL
jgi:NitT/TauT family transport system permease protein